MSAYQTSQRSMSVVEQATFDNRVAVVRVMLTRFRNYRTAVVSLDAATCAPVVITGENGAGKTNLLEALSLLSPGRGLRGAKLRDMQQKGADSPWAVAARLNIGNDRCDLGTGLQPAEDSRDAKSDRRVIRIDGEPASGPSALSNHLAVTWITPDMDRLFREGASARRRFLDRLVLALHPGHGTAVNAYEKAMRQRNRLLEEPASAADPAWLDGLERSMAEQAVAIAAARHDLVGALSRLAPRSWGSNGDIFPRAGLALDGLIEEWLANSAALEVEERFAHRLRDLRPVDRLAGRATEGTHKTDLEVLHLGKDMPASQCSTGEQKALLVAIVLANARLVQELSGRGPLMLLDEVAAHLDEARRAALFGQIGELGSQVWMTGTDRMLFAALEGHAHYLRIDDGAIEAA